MDLNAWTSMHGSSVGWRCKSRGPDVLCNTPSAAKLSETVWPEDVGYVDKMIDFG